MSLSSINDMDSHNLIIALYSDALENDNTIAEPQFTIDGNNYSTLTWSGTTMPKPTEAQLIAKYNSIKNTIRDKLVRERRDRLLIESDKYAVKDFPFRTKDKRDQWISYRTNLRNLTDNLNNFTLDLNNFEITNFDTHKPTEPQEETGLETKTFDENDTIVDGKFIITGHNTLNNFLIGDGTSYVPKTPSQIKSILDLEVGTDVQAYDPGLNAIANISPSNNKIAVFSGPTTAKLIDFRDEDNMISNSSTSIPSQQSVKAYVDTKISGIVDSAPGTLDTLNELAAALGDDANFSTTISTSLGEKLVKSSNLSDLTNASTARTNLGLVIGSDVQAYNANLVPVSANTGSSAGGDLSTINIGGTNYSIPSGGASTINDLSNVNISSPSNGQVLKYNGSSWVNGTIDTSGNSSSNFNGITVGNTGITCSSFLDIEGEIKMANMRRIEWVNSNISIYGRSDINALIVDGDDKVSLNADNEINNNTPLTIFQTGLTSGPEVKIHASNQDASSAAKLSLVARNSYTPGYGWQLNSNAAKLQFITDRHTKNVFDRVILELVGNSNTIYSQTNVSGYLNVNSQAYFKNLIKLDYDKKLYWGGSTTSYITGNATTMTIESNDYLKLYSDIETKVYSYQMKLEGSSTTVCDFEIKNTYSSGAGKASITLIGDNGNDLGDGWRIACGGSQMTFSSDNATDATYNTEILKLTNHATQSSRLVNIYGKLDVDEDIIMSTSKKLRWSTVQYLQGDLTNFTMECNKTLTVNADTSIAFNSATSSFSGNLDVSQGLDVTGNITCSGDLDIEDEIIMGASKRIKWDNTTGPFMYGSSTILTIDGKTKINSSATTSMTFTTPTATFTGNLNASSGLDVTGNITCSGKLDIGGIIEMDANDKIEWANGPDIYGSAARLYINGDATTINNTTDTLIVSPSILQRSTNSGGPEFMIKGTNTTNGDSKITLVSRNAYNLGDSWQLKNTSQKLQFICDKSAKTILNDVILELVGDGNPLLSTTNVKGKLNVSASSIFNSSIQMLNNNRLFWNDANTFISGNETTLTIDGDNEVKIYANNQLFIDTPKIAYHKIYNGTLNFEIKNNYGSSSGGPAALTLISDAGGDAGDSWQIKSHHNILYFYNDSTTKGTITTNILKLTNHATQSSRLVNIYGKLDVDEDIIMSTSKKLRWSTVQYLQGDLTNFTMECNKTLTVNADTSIAFNSATSSFSGNLDVSQGLDVTGNITCSGDLDIEDEIIMGASKRIKWDNTTGPFMYGSSTILTIDGKTKINSSATTSMTFTTPNASFTGNLNASSGLDVTGNITCSGYLDIEGVIKMGNGDKIEWVNSDTHIYGTDTTLYIDGDTIVSIIGSTKALFTTPLIEHTNSVSGGPEFKIKGTNTTDGDSKITLVSKNSYNYGDSWQLKNTSQKLQFICDKSTKTVLNDIILELDGNANPLLSNTNVKGKLNVSNGFSLDVGSDASGDMYYRNASGNFARIGKGTTGQVLKMNSSATAPEWGDSTSGGVTISNNVNNRVLTGDGTNANAEANMTFSGSALNVVGTITCDTSLTIDTSVLDASDILHISDITEGTATGSKALVLNSSKGVSGIGTLGCSSIGCPSFSTSSNANIELDPNGSGVVVFKGNSTRGSGQFKLNCENNSHGITIKGPPHSANATYTLTLPDTDGNSNQVLKTDGSGNLSWTDMTSGGASALNDLSDVSISSLSSGQVLKYNGTNWVNDTDNTGSGGGGGGLPTGVSYTGSGASAEFVVTGNIRATADITAYHSSDRRFKDNLTRISEPNEKIKKINGYEFDWNEKHEHYKNTHDVGVVAQEIEEVLPEVVTEREDGYKAVKYERIIALLIESNKDLLRRVEELEEKLKK